MFLVEKSSILPANLFRSSKNKKPRHQFTPHHLAAQSLDLKITHHLKTLTLALSQSQSQSQSPNSLTYLTASVQFLSNIHTDSLSLILDLKCDFNEASEMSEMKGLYDDYSLKLLDLLNIVSASLRKMTDMRMLINYAIRLMKFDEQVSDIEKLNKMSKAKDVIDRCVKDVPGNELEKDEKRRRAKDLIKEMSLVVERLGKSKSRIFYAIGVLTVFIGKVMVNGLFGGVDDGSEVRGVEEFSWGEAVKELEKAVFETVEGKGSTVLLEVDEVVRQAVIVRGLIEGVEDVDGKVRLAEGVKDMELKVTKLSDGVDALNKGVNGLFSNVLKTRNGSLDGN